jgi:hypothetical protein
MRFTYHVVLSFYLSKRGTVEADQPIEAESAASAIRVAQRLAPHKVAVVAFSRTGDAATGYFTDAEVLWQCGELPEEHDLTVAA